MACIGGGPCEVVLPGDCIVCPQAGYRMFSFTKVTSTSTRSQERELSGGSNSNNDSTISLTTGKDLLATRKDGLSYVLVERKDGADDESPPGSSTMGKRDDKVYVLVEQKSAIVPSSTNLVTSSQQPTVGSLLSKIMQQRVSAGLKSGMGFKSMPSFISTVQVKNFKMRFFGVGSGAPDTWTLNVNHIFYLLSFCATATAAYNLISSWRLKSTEVFMVSGASTYGEQYATIVPGIGQSHAPHMAKALTVSTDAAGSKLTYVPTKNSEMGWWFSDPTDTSQFLQYRNCFSNSSATTDALTIVDINLDVTMTDSTESGAAHTVAGGTVGTIFPCIPKTSGNVLLYCTGYVPLTY